MCETTTVMIFLKHGSQTNKIKILLTLKLYELLQFVYMYTNNIIYCFINCCKVEIKILF